MAHAPQDPAVRAAYSALIDQTVAQYRALEAAGYRFWLMDPDADPYAANPAAAMRDLRATKTMAVFPSDAGFGSSDLDVSNNPLLADTGISWPYGSLDGEPRPVLANDLFRAVHDAFGHGLEGAGFRAQGEENAWQSHVRLFTGAALGAITSETRGQNSWLNYGPHGETNKIAKVEDTIFADQKTGLMPEWTWAEGLASDAEVRQSRKPTPGTPTPLYVSRNVIDDGGLRQWAIDAGLTDVLALDDMHVTITYSREPVDIADAPAEGGDASARAGGRAVTLNTALAMPVKAMALNKGHDRYMAAGASHDYGDKYTPHVTLKYDATPEDTAALEAAPPFIGTVRLGPEVQDVLRPGGEEIDAGDANLDETLMEYGIPISSAVDASKRYSDGQRIFAVSEMDEGATEVTSMEMLRAYTPDQLLALTRAVAAEQGLPEPAQILQSRRPDPQTQTPAFKAWFGDSKVVDENGDPLVVYHATDADFDTFEIGDVGFHFGSAESAASRADGVRDNITRRWSRQREKTLATYLSIKNPLRLPDAGDWSDPDQVAGIVSDMYTTDEAWMDRYQLAADKLVPDFSNDNGESFRAIFEDMGYDGIVYDNVGEGGGDSFIAFRPNQIKSATANSGAFDPENPSILQERRTPSKAHQERGGKLAGLSVQGFPVATLAQSGSNWVLTQKTKKQALFTEIRRVMQDRMINVRNALDDIQSAIGGPISDLANLYQAENLMHGKAADGVRRVQDAFIDPLKALIKRTAIPVGDVERYLWAKHALERNARIAQINPGMQDGGSGLTDQEAQEILDGFDKAGLTPKLEMIDRRTQQLRKDTLDTLKESGQITPTEYASLLGMYQHYVPLRGRAGEEGEARVGGGKGVDMRGKPVRRALGRRTQPANILGELVGDSERAQVVAAKAEVARTLLRAALEYPNPDFWVVEPVTVEPRYSEASGEVYLGIANDQNEEDVVIVKHKGKPYKVRLVDPDLRAAMKNVGVEGFEAVGKYLGWVNRWLSAVFTRYNPAFVPINMIRDWIQGTIGVGSQLGAKSILDVARIYPGAVAGLISEARGNGDASVPDAQKTPTDWAREFLESGASTGYATFQDTAMLQSQIENEMATFAQMVRSGQPVAAVGEAVRRSQLFQTIETANEIVENGTRLSTYIHMRKSGASREKAATFAKNLTVNFNRKGSGAAVGNAMFLFFNASIQGSHRVLKLLRDPRVVATLVAAGTAQFVMAMTMGAAKYEDDDETLWEKIPDHVRQKAFVIPTGYSEDGSPQYVAIPMPFGFNMFTYLGGYPALMSSKTWMSRNNAKRKVPGDLARAGIDAFSVVPIGEEGWYWPTVARIFVNMQANKDDLGRRIRASEGFGAKLPRSSQGRADTAGGYKAIATALNRLGGGDDYTKPITAMLDYAPEDIEYMVNMFAGGPGNIMNQLWKTAEKVNADVPLAASDIPVSSRVIGSTRSPSVTSKFFYESKEIMDKGVLQLKDAYVSGGWDAFQAKRDELGPQFAGVIPAVYKTSSREKGYRAGQIRTSETGAPILIGYPGSTYEAFKQVSTGVSDYGDAIRATYNNTALSSAERRREVERLQMERADAMRYFLDAWNYDASSLTGASD